MGIGRSRVIGACLSALAAMLALLVLPATPSAQNWPTRPLTLVVPFAAGGPSDVAGRTPDDLCGAAHALWRFAARRPKNTAKVRVYNPTEGRDGWASPHTIVEIVNDDMPFLFDSVMGELTEQRLAIQLVSHPVFTLERDSGARLRASFKARLNSAADAHSSFPISQYTPQEGQFRGSSAGSW